MSAEFNHELGVVARQAARRRAPLPPGGAVNLLAVQRSGAADAATNVALALEEAWERGLLRPGVADAVLLDWGPNPGNLALLARALRLTAHAGMLSVVWPLLDDLVARCCTADTRMPPGTVDLVELQAELLPEVARAVERGCADATALEMPGLRAAAARGGSSRTVVVARAAVRNLPDAGPGTTTDPAASQAGAPTPPPADFDEIWPADAGQAPDLPDGARVRMTWSRWRRGWRVASVAFTLPERPGKVHCADLDESTYILEAGLYDVWCAEGDLDRPPSQEPTRGWAHFDVATGRLVVEEGIDRMAAIDGLRRRGSTPLSHALQVVALAMVASDGEVGLRGRHFLNDLVEKEATGWRAIRAATAALLESPDFSPDRLVGALERHPGHLPFLWPALTESVRAAGEAVGEGTGAPRWTARVLQVALARAPYLREAARRGLIVAPDSDWRGLAALASAPGRSAAVTRARRLQIVLGLDG